jgi:hypothetical protein
VIWMESHRNVLSSISCPKAGWSRLTRSCLGTELFLFPFLDVHAIKAGEKAEKQNLSSAGTMSDIATGLGTGIRSAVIRTSWLAAGETNRGSAFGADAMSNWTCRLHIRISPRQFIPDK